MSTFIVPLGESSVRPRRARWWATTTVAVLTAALAIGGLVPPTAAVADTAPKNPADITTPETVSTDALPTPQINGVAWDQLVVGDTVYVAGSFTSARPFGAKPGVNETPRANLLAYNLKTGDLLPYAPSFNAQIRALAVSPDGKRLYAVGHFTIVNGQPRYRVAALDLPSGNLVAGFKPFVDTSLTSVQVTDGAVYVGGSLSKVAQSTGASNITYARTKAAAFSASDGKVLPWAPSMTSGWVNSMILSPNGDKMVLGGSFKALNGSSNPGWTMGAVDTVTGTTTLPWKINATVPQHNFLEYDQSVYSLASDGEFVYGVAGPAAYEGTFKASWSDGALETGWLADCHGDTYSVAPVGDVVYTASHAHDCDNLDGFGDYAAPDKWYRALAFTKATTQTTRTENGGYSNYAGTPAPSLLDWYPTFDIGKATGQGPWDVATAQGYVLYAGEFGTVNRVGQQGLTRFGPKSVAPNKDGPALEGPNMVPTVTNWGYSYTKLQWTANYDRDNANLTYQVIRDGNTAKPVFVTTVESRFWQRPTITAIDGYLKAGQTYKYRIRTIDPHGNVKWGNEVPYTAPATTPWSPGYVTSYDKVILQDQPASYWSMNEPGEWAYDWARDNNHVHLIAPKRVPGPEPITSSATSTAADYANGHYSASHSRLAAPQVFTAEAWVKTTSTSGGQIVGYAGSWAATGIARDRVVYMNPDGRLGFYVYNGGGNSINSTKSYNDGQWHSVSASLSSEGMKLYVDGVEVATQPTVTSAYVYPTGGYWQIGGAEVTTSNMLTAAVDNVAIFDRALTATQVSAHYKAASVEKPNSAPAAAFSSSTKDLEASVDASGSTDADGSIASYAWDFGDTSTGTGKTASHAYATAGTFTVKLTVTDDKGSTSTVSKPVTVTAPVKPDAGSVAADAFARSVSSGWGSAVTGGNWKQSGNSGGTSVANGVGVLASAKGQTRTMMLPSVSAASTDTTVSFRIDKASTGGGQYVSVIGRQVGADSYSARVWVQASGAMQLQLQRGGTVLNGVNLTGVTYTVGQKVFVRLHVSGSGTTTLNAKAWTTGTEPAAWQVTATDTTAALQAAGSVGLSTYLSSSSASDAVFSVDDYRVVRPG